MAQYIGILEKSPAGFVRAGKGMCERPGLTVWHTPCSMFSKNFEWCHVRDAR